MLDYLSHPVWMLAIGVVSVARFTRLVTHDKWPPMEWARPRIAAKLGGWAEVMVCPFCAAPWLMAGQFLWWWLLHDHASHDVFAYGWLLPNLWWAVSYVAAIVVAYDQPED